MFSVCRRSSAGSLEWMVVFKVLHIIPQRLARCVVVLLSKDDRSLSEAQVTTWVDAYKESLNRKKKSEKDTDPKDKLLTKTKSRTGWHCRRTEGNLNTKQFDYVVVKLKKKGFSDQSHPSPPHSHSIIYNVLGFLIYLMFTPPPRHPFFTHCH